MGLAIWIILSGAIVGAQAQVLPVAWTKSLAEIQNRGLEKGQVANIPWNDDNWALNFGGAAQRFQDPEFRQKTQSWNALSTYALQEKPLQKFLKSENSLLAPTEKYDLLIRGEESAHLLINPLTQASWAEGKYQAVDGIIEEWVGLGYGWSLATQYFLAPQHEVTVQNSLGDKIIFTAKDIRALTALFFSKVMADITTWGQRCTSDRLSDRLNLEAEDCVDLNPAFFHLLLANRVGLQKKNLVVDTDPLRAVLNHPVISYQIAYYHPVTKQVANYSTAKLAKKYNGENYFVVGVKLQVSYANSSVGSAFLSNQPLVEEYDYQLELDEKDQVTGGVWLSAHHPDFAWAANVGNNQNTKFLPKFPMTTWDQYISGEWLSGDMPQEWQANAQKAALDGEPLQKIIFYLLQHSSESSK